MNEWWRSKLVCVRKMNRNLNKIVGWASKQESKPNNNIGFKRLYNLRNKNVNI